MAYKEKDTKKWTAQWFETNARGEKKKRRKRGFETKREALEYERQKKLNNSRSMDMKLSEFMEVYFEDKQNELKERTMKNKRYMMEQHIIPYFGNQMMSEITAGQIIQWQNEMQTKGFSEAYLRMIQNQLTSLFTHASRIYDLHTNPCKKVKRMGSSDNRSLDFWTVDEYQKFIQTMEPGSRYYLIFEILFWTGCRIGELLALTPKDVDFERNQISITKTYYRTERQDVITDPGDGKTTLILNIAAKLSKGEGMDNDMKLMESMNIIYQTAEDGLADTVKPRLEKAGADCERILIIDESDKSLSMADDRLEEAIIQTGARMLILDPIQAYLGGGIDMNRANEARDMTKRLGALAEKYKCAIILIGHMNKASGNKAAYRGMGSIDFFAVARSVLLVGRVEGEPNIRAVVQIKNNLAQFGHPKAFELMERGFKWMGDYEITADEVLGGIAPKANKLEQAKRMLRELAETSNAVQSNEIFDMAEEQGISKRTLENAKKELCIRARKINDSWYWELDKIKQI